MEKKQYLTSIGILLVFAIVFSAFMPSFASFNGIEINDSLKETNRNSYYSLVGGDLIASFPKVLIQNEYGEKEVIAYPPEYAGAYIDESNTLHILLTKNANMTTESSYLEIMDNDEDIIFDNADFPLSRLYEIQRTLDPIMQEFSIEYTSLNEITNKLEIHLLDSTKEKEITEFLENKFNDFDARCITFEDPIGGFRFTEADTASNALAGSNTASSTGGATLGFNAYRHATGNAGVVTAAHYATSGTSIDNALGTTIGTASIRQLSGDIDAAFVPFPVGIIYSYKISGLASPDDCITHYYPNSEYIIGTTVDKRGRTTGTTSGTIVSVSTSIPVGGITFTDQVHISNTQIAGDSGGPVFHTITQAGTDFHILVGIATIADPNNEGYVSKVDNIMSAFGITPYVGE